MSERDELSFRCRIPPLALHCRIDVIELYALSVLAVIVRVRVELAIAKVSPVECRTRSRPTLTKCPYHSFYSFEQRVNVTCVLAARKHSQYSGARSAKRVKTTRPMVDSPHGATSQNTNECDGALEDISVVVFERTKSHTKQRDGDEIARSFSLSLFSHSSVPIV